MLRIILLVNQVEEKLEGGQGKTSIRRFFSRFCTPIFLEASTLFALHQLFDRNTHIYTCNAILFLCSPLF